MNKALAATNGGRVLSALRLIAINVVVIACLLEIVLRVQQRLGPLFDLDLHAATLMAGLSNELNHVPVPGKLWDGDGFRRMDEPNSAQCEPKVLFMGDSFMQGVLKTPDEGYIASLPADTVPVAVRRYIRDVVGKDLCVFNAGYASYSPSIYVPQAKQLIPLVHPDVVVIDVDETDIYDDYYRYRPLTIRDATGSIVGVPPTPINVRFLRGLLESTSKLFYVHRLFSKLYFTKVEFPRLLGHAEQTKPQDNLVLSKLPDAEERRDHSTEIAYFKMTLDDMITTVLARMDGPKTLVLVHHPHLGHLQSTGVVFNNVVSATLQEAATRRGVDYYDATEDLRKVFGREPEKYYIPDDMHFNPDGTREYGIAVAKHLAARFQW